MSPSERKQIQDRAHLIWQASRPVRVLRSLSWPAIVRRRFLDTGGERLPEVEYPEFDPSPVLEILDRARQGLGTETRVDRWLGRAANSVEAGARMLYSVGRPEFFAHSALLYGKPSDSLADGMSTSLGLAQQFKSVLDSLANVDIGAPPLANRNAEDVAGALELAVAAMFGDRAPKIAIVEELSANALAGPRQIRLRGSATFTDKDVDQLIHHEAYIHVATALNGADQVDLPLLGGGHPGITRTQEGLAVFAEFISGSVDLDRLRRLADRVIAIDMAAHGADFIEVYRYFLLQCDGREQAFENTRRVFRGGVLTGGAPFTKDIVYLDGLLRVHNFLRAVVMNGRADCLRLLFCGKIDIEDIPVLCELMEAGLCHPPTFLPPWAADLRFLLGYLAYSAFLNTVDLTALKSHYQAMLDRAPVVQLGRRGLGGPV